MASSRAARRLQFTVPRFSPRRHGLFALAIGVALLAIALLLQPSHKAAPSTQTLPGLQVGQVAPDFTLRDTHGALVHLAALRGRPVLLNFWSTTCTPCRSEMPELERAYRTATAHTTAGRPAPRILGIDADTEDRTTVERFGHTLGVTYPLLLDPLYAVTLARYHVYSIPLSITLDPRGREQALHLGPMSLADVTKALHGDA